MLGESTCDTMGTMLEIAPPFAAAEGLTSGLGPTGVVVRNGNEEDSVLGAAMAEDPGHGPRRGRVGPAAPCPRHAA
jgi:hypothetical protein